MRSARVAGSKRRFKPDKQRRTDCSVRLSRFAIRTRLAGTMQLGGCQSSGDASSPPGERDAHVAFLHAPNGSLTGGRRRRRRRHAQATRRRFYSCANCIVPAKVSGKEVAEKNSDKLVSTKFAPSNPNTDVQGFKDEAQKIREAGGLPNKNLYH